VALLVAVNPAAVAVALWPSERRREMAVAAAVTLVVAVVLAGVSGPLLDALDVSPPTFLVAAAIVLGLVGARWLVLGAPSLADEGPAAGWGRVGVPLLIPALITPQLVMVSVAVGADEGVALVAAGAAVGLVLAWAAATVTKRREAVWNTGVRIVGALAVALALALAVDGVKTI
jgi:small neutral amino acid transporter SnatA (MarC family)